MARRRFLINRSWRFASLLSIMLLVAAVGCELAQRRDSAPTQSDRLMRAYPQLQNGRFAIIADFERPEHMELFQLRGSSPEARFHFDRRRGRKETGRGCLAFRSGSANDAIIIGNASSRNWYLKRDWRDYDLLMLSVFASRDDLLLETSLSAGASNDRSTVTSAEPLSPGWNALQFDLAEIAEHIALDDIQEIQMRVLGANGSTEIFVDDVILAGNRFDLFGDSQGEVGRLYVRVHGRRWLVGVNERFELTFANGQIVAWYNLAVDPNRIHNLVEGTTLGPTPMALTGPSLEPGDFSALGKRIAASPRLVEANTVRVVVASEWRFVGEDRATTADSAYQRWVFTIYATGQMFVSVEATAATRTWEPDALGLAVAVSKPNAFIRNIQSAGGTTGEASTSPAYALVSSEDQLLSLLYVVDAASAEMEMIERVDSSLRRLTYLAVGPRGAQDVARWQAHLFMDSQGPLSPEQGKARAEEFQHPPPLDLLLGRPVADNHGAGGFDRASGCYVIAPDRGRVRFTLGEKGRTRYLRSFKIPGTADQRAWIYVNHLIRDDFARDAHGDIIFQLPEPVTSRTLVEVLLRPLAPSREPEK